MHKDLTVITKLINNPSKDCNVQLNFTLYCTYKVDVFRSWWLFEPGFVKAAEYCVYIIKFWEMARVAKLFAPACYGSSLDSNPDLLYCNSNKNGRHKQMSGQHTV